MGHVVIPIELYVDQSRFSFIHNLTLSFEPAHDKTNKVACVPSEDSDQPGNPPRLIKVFAVHMKKAWVLSYPLSIKQKLWSDWADAQADLIRPDMTESLLTGTLSLNTNRLIWVFAGA